jgi:hypothetical protein
MVTKVFKLAAFHVNFKVGTNNKFEIFFLIKIYVNTLTVIFLSKSDIC